MTIGPDLLGDWPVMYPHRSRPWTLRRGDQWAVLDPEASVVTSVDPACDCALPGLAPALESGQLIGYRARRRAVVLARPSSDRSSASSYVKVVRPRRLRALVAAHTAIEDWPEEVTLPTVRNATEDGRLTIARVAGTSLHEMLRTKPWSELHRSVDAVAHSLIGFHQASSRHELDVRSHDDPGELIAMVDRYASAHAVELSAELSCVARRLPELGSGGTQLTHGDLHDKNVLVGGATLLGLIDLDGLSRGYGEDDVANLAMHLQLRSLQAFGDEEPGLALAERLYQAYEQGAELDRDRCRAVEAHTWFRLACLYSFRRASVGLVPEFVRRTAASSA